MKKFKFNLEALLSYRRHLEKTAKLEVAEVQAEITKLKDILEDIKRERAAAETKVLVRTESGVNGEVLRQYDEYFKGLLFQKKVLSQRVSDLGEILVQKQKKLKQKSIEKKVIENLKARKNAEYYQAFLKAEMKQADENALLRRDIHED